MSYIQLYISILPSFFLLLIFTLSFVFILLLPTLACATNFYEGISIPGWSSPKPLSVPSHRERRRGCHEVGAFHVHWPPVVNCSAPRQCRHSSRLALCRVQRVRAYDTKCKRYDRRGRCKRLAKLRGWVNVCVRRCKSITEANGSGDPHFTTFDGRRFDFQGAENKYYLVFSKSCGGDRLVTRMRGSRYRNYGVKATYFDAFGLTTGNSDAVVNKILIETVLRNGSNGSNESEKGKQKWSVRVSLNGEVVSSKGFTSLCPSNGSTDDRTLHIEKEGSQIVNVTITTPDAVYRVRAKRLWKVTRHLDVNIGLRHSLSARFTYGGLLGHTLNAAVKGHSDMSYYPAEEDGDYEHSFLTRRRRGRKRKRMINSKVEEAKNLERSLRKRFETSSLFPDEAEQGETLALPTVGRLVMGYAGPLKRRPAKRETQTQTTFFGTATHVIASIVHDVD